MVRHHQQESGGVGEKRVGIITAPGHTDTLPSKLVVMFDGAVIAPTEGAFNKRLKVHTESTFSRSVAERR